MRHDLYISYVESYKSRIYIEFHIYSTCLYGCRPKNFSESDYQSRISIFSHSGSSAAYIDAPHCCDCPVLPWQAPTTMTAVAVPYTVKYPLLDIGNKALRAYRMEAKFGAERWYIKSSMVDSRLELLGNQYSLNERDVLITLWFNLEYEGNWMRDGHGTQHAECMVLLILIDGFTI